MAVLPDDASPIAFIGYPSNPEEYSLSWQEGVEIIYRLLKCDILRLWPVHLADTEEKKLVFVRALAQQNPYGDLMKSYGPPWDMAWMEPLFHTSDRGKTLIKAYGSNGHDSTLCPGLIQELEALFETSGVPWSDCPTFPIHKDLESS